MRAAYLLLFFFGHTFFRQVLSDVVYCWYAGYFVDEAKRFFLPVWYVGMRLDVCHRLLKIGALCTILLWHVTACRTQIATALVFDITLYQR